MLRSTKAILTLGSFNPPTAGLLELRDAMNERFPRKLLRDYDTVDVVDVMSSLAARGLVEESSVCYYTLSESGITQATLLAAKHRQEIHAHTACGT